MESLIRELDQLKSAPSVTNRQLVGAVLAVATRVDKALDERMVGIQSFAMAVAMQPAIDAKRLQQDFATILGSQFDSLSRMPADLRDMVSALGIALADRH